MVITTALILTACGSLQAPFTCISDSKCVSYAAITESKSQGIAASVTGEAETLKVTVYGDVSDWKITYKGTKGTATLNGGATDDQ